MSKVQTIEKNGIVYSVHSVKAANGKTGSVEVPRPKDLDTLNAIVDSGIDNWEHIAGCYNAHFAVEAQAALRRTLLGGKMSIDDIRRIHNAIITTDVFAEAQTKPDAKAYIDNLIYAHWIDEQDENAEQTE